MPILAILTLSTATPMQFKMVYKYSNNKNSKYLKYLKAFYLIFYK